MSVLEIKDLGLAAFAKLKGLKLISCENRTFKFEGIDGVTRAILEVEYCNSCCRQHDNAVMSLRQLLY